MPAPPTPTPTRTLTPTPYLGPWLKLKGSYASRFRLQSTIPASLIAYDSDDATQAYFHNANFPPQPKSFTTEHTENTEKNI